MRFVCRLVLFASLGILALPLSAFAAPERPEITGIALVRLRVSNMDASGSLRSVNGNVEILDSVGGFSAHTTNAM